MMNGGYLMVSKTDTNLYEKLNNALTSGKPILWYEDENTCYYIDSITKSGTDIILTKGGKTITIENDGDITESGNIQEKIHEYIITLILNSSSEGDGTIYNINFRYITNKELPLYTNEPLTQEIANSVVNDYSYIPLCEEESETMLYAYNNKFIENTLDVRATDNELFIVSNSTITINKLF